MKIEELEKKLNELEKQREELNTQNNKYLTSGDFPKITAALDNLKQEIKQLLENLNNIDSNEKTFKSMKLTKTTAEQRTAYDSFEALKIQVLAATETRSTEIEELLTHLKETRNDLNDKEKEIEFITKNSTSDDNTKGRLLKRAKSEAKIAATNYDNNANINGRNITPVANVNLITQRKQVINSKKVSRIVVGTLLTAALAGGVLFFSKGCQKKVETDYSDPKIGYSGNDLSSMPVATPIATPTATPVATPIVTPDSLEYEEEIKKCEELSKTLYSEITANNNQYSHFEFSEEETRLFVAIIRGHIPDEMPEEEVFDFLNQYMDGLVNVQADIANKFYGGKGFELTQINLANLFDSEIKGTDSLKLQSDLCFEVLESADEEELKERASKLAKFCEAFYLNRSNVINIDGKTYNVTNFAVCTPEIQFCLYGDLMNALVIPYSIDPKILGDERNIEEIVNVLYQVVENCDYGDNVNYNYIISTGMLDSIRQAIKDKEDIECVVDGAVLSFPKMN